MFTENILCCSHSYSSIIKQKNTEAINRKAKYKNNQKKILVESYSPNQCPEEKQCQTIKKLTILQVLHEQVRKTKSESTLYGVFEAIKKKHVN